MDGEEEDGGMKSSRDFMKDFINPVMDGHVFKVKFESLMGFSCL